MTLMILKRNFTSTEKESSWNFHKEQTLEEILISVENSAKINVVKL